MAAKTHSILKVVNAHADVERSIRDRHDVNSHSKANFVEAPVIGDPDRIANLNRNKTTAAENASRNVSWGILFDSEFICASEVGPMLIVFSNTALDSSKPLSVESTKLTISNCCILLFEKQLSTRSPLRIFHGQ